MSEIRSVDFPKKDLPLRNDVSVLGRLVGDALVEQHGQELLDQVETVRRAAILRREGDDASADRLEATLRSLSVEEVLRVIKAFSTYLRLANLAEKVHRIRRRRAYQKEGSPAQVGSLQDVIASLTDSGVEPERIARAVGALTIRPVFTAHPTEATRRSFLEKEYSIIHRLVERLNPDRTPEEEQQSLDRIRDAIHSAWQTSTVPGSKPRVSDELDNVLFYLTEILYRVVPPFYESLNRALTGKGMDPVPVERIGRLLRFGSWVGGDMDGNPNVTADTIGQTLATQRAAIIRRYLPEVEKLARYLSQTRSQAGIAPELEARLDTYLQRMPEAAEGIPERHRDMPYRCLLRLVSARLRQTLDEGAHAYGGPGELLDDIVLVCDSLAANRGRYAGLFGARRLQQRIASFGFHLATLDVRQDALVHRRVMGAILERRDWEELGSDERCRVLERFLAEPPAAGRAPDVAADSLAVFDAIRQGRERYGEAAIGLFIISMTQGADDVLTALALAHRAGLAEAGVPLDVAPLLETVDDLAAGPDILEQLLCLGVYREHLARRGDRQVIMVGYSDSNKDSGIVSARWNLQEAQAKLVAIGHRHGVAVQFFHGRGGTVSRGGGNLVQGIEGAPADTIQGYFRVTEQGEVINQKYGIRPIALRNLELITGAVLRHGLTDTGQDATPAECAIMQEMATDARRHYRALVYETPGFDDFFRHATPIDVIQRLAIGSRPSSRRSGEGIGDLRAIPWVFSWAQVRVGFPGVFGMGTALERAIEAHGMDRMRAMLRRWTFFGGLLNDVEMVLAKSDLEIGERYAQLAPAETRALFTPIGEEFERTRRHLLDLREEEELLQGQRTLQRNIRLRNPYADPMHLLQINLLRRWRETGREDDELLFALKSTVNGIALAIQNTG